MKTTAFVFASFIVLAVSAQAHDWYSSKTDPVYRWNCCGGHDCARWKIERGSVEGTERGLHVRLTLEQSKLINPQSMAPIDTIVTWDRVQPSEDGDWHLCIMTSARWPGAGGVYCLFAPPNS